MIFGGGYVTRNTPPFTVGGSLLIGSLCCLAVCLSAVSLVSAMLGFRPFTTWQPVRKQRILIGRGQGWWCEWQYPPDQVFDSSFPCCCLSSSFKLDG